MANPIEFEQQNFTWGVPKGAETTMRPLPCYVEWGSFRDPRAANGGKNFKAPVNTLSKWELSDEEIDFIVKNRFVWLKQHNAGNPLQAQLIIAGPIEFPKPYAFCIVYYRAEKSLKGISVYVSGNFDIIDLISLGDELYSFDQRYTPKFVGPDYGLNIDDYFFRVPMPDEAKSRAIATITEWENSDQGKATTDEAARADMRAKIEQMSFSAPLLCRIKQAGAHTIIG
jgi:hypothetical protein